MRLRNLLFFLALLPGLSAAQGSISLDFGEEGDREIWIAERLAMPTSTQKSAEKAVEVPVSDKGGKLFVWDRKTGNIASKPVSELKAGWKLTPADYQLAGKVTVRVVHEDERVAVAFVKLKDANGERDSQIDASKNGEAVFFGVKPGNVKVTVRYVSKGTDAEPAEQGFVVNAKRSEPDPTLIVSLAQEVETVGSKPAGDTPGKAEPDKGAAASGQTAKAPPAQGSPIGSAIIYLLVLAAVGAGIFFGLRYMKENQDKVKAQLQKVGVQVPDPQDPAQQDPGPAPIPIPPAPPEKIILTDADPNVPAAAVPVAPSVPSVSVSQPSLVMGNGDVFPIPDGQTFIGREAANGLALVTESTVSRRHASLTYNGADVTIRDEGSSNGTFVNGVKIASDTVLRPGDQVQFGEARFRYEA